MCFRFFEVILGEAVGNYLQIAERRRRDQHDEQLTTVSHLKWQLDARGLPFPCHWETADVLSNPVGFLENHQS